VVFKRDLKEASEGADRVSGSWELHTDGTAVEKARCAKYEATVGFKGNWTTRGYANSRTANSRTGQVADWSTRGLADAAKKEN